ncbi:MAG: M15 family metallopeptidase [Actinomycetes bacterium]
MRTSILPPRAVRPRRRRTPALLATLLVAAGACTGTVTPGQDRAAPSTASPDATSTDPGDDPSRTPDDPAAEPADPRGTLLAWGRGDITVDLVDVVAALPSVDAVAHTRSETLGLVAAFDAAGAGALDLPAGFAVPVDVAAVDPATHPDVLAPGPHRDAVAALRPGEALLTDTGAALRRIGAGGRLGFTGGTVLRVVGVVSDWTAGRAEVVAHVADADALGIEPDGSLVVRHTAGAGAETDALADALAATLPADVTARVVDAGTGGQEARRAPLVLSLSQVKERFGEPAFRPRDGVREVDIDPAFRDEHVVTREVPLLGSVTCHAGIIDDLTAALEDVVAAGFGGWVDPARYGGCWYPRRIRTDGARLSRHTWGIAIDINVDLAQPGGGEVPPEEVVAAFARHGFRWGGDFLTTDNHHWEWVGPALAAQRPDRDDVTG